VHLSHRGAGSNAQGEFDALAIITRRARYVREREQLRSQTRIAITLEGYAPREGAALEPGEYEGDLARDALWRLSARLLHGRFERADRIGTGRRKSVRANLESRDWFVTQGTSHACNGSRSSVRETPRRRGT